MSTGHFRKTLVRLLVNGEEHTLAVPVQRTLLEALRYELGLTGSKQGCDQVADSGQDSICGQLLTSLKSAGVCK